MIDTIGTAVVYYKYDAWGKLISKTGTMAATLGTLNSFRYRGYLFDEETGVYYLRSRYFNAVEYRFINADSQIVTNTRTSVDSNLFAYCNNGPVHCDDPDGQNALDAALPTLVGISSMDGPLPILDICCMVVAGCLAIYDTVSLYQVASSAINSTSTKTLADVKVRLDRSNYKYQLAYVSDSGDLIKGNLRLNLSEAITVLSVTGSVNICKGAHRYNRSKSSEAQRQLEHLGSGNWGVYANSQEAAKALAVIFSGYEAPEVHSSGMYGHYHDGTHTFHIWYGGVLNY